MTSHFLVSQYMDINGERSWCVFTKISHKNVSTKFKIKSNAEFNATLLNDYWNTPLRKDWVQKERRKDWVQKERLNLWDQLVAIMQERGMPI